MRKTLQRVADLERQAHHWPPRGGPQCHQPFAAPTRPHQPSQCLPAVRMLPICTHDTVQVTLPSALSAIPITSCTYVGVKFGRKHMLAVLGQHWPWSRWQIHWVGSKSLPMHTCWRCHVDVTSHVLHAATNLIRTAFVSLTIVCAFHWTFNTKTDLRLRRRSRVACMRLSCQRRMLMARTPANKLLLPWR